MKEFTRKEMKDLLVRFAQNIMDYESELNKTIFIGGEGGCPERLVEIFLRELKKQEKTTACIISYECPGYDRMYLCKYFKQSDSKMCAHRILNTCTCVEAQIEELESELKELRG